MLWRNARPGLPHIARSTPLGSQPSSCLLIASHETNQSSLRIGHTTQSLGNISSVFAPFLILCRGRSMTSGIVCARRWADTSARHIPFAESAISSSKARSPFLASNHSSADSIVARSWLIILARRRPSIVYLPTEDQQFRACCL